MARQRFIYPEIWTDEKFARLKPIERLFFIGLFSNCDDEGRICASPAYLRSIIFPFDRISVKKVKQIRDSVVQNFSSILLYSCGENEYLQLQNFKKYQKPKYPRPSKIPPPQGFEGNSQKMFPEKFLQNGENISETFLRNCSTGSGSGKGSNSDRVGVVEGMGSGEGEEKGKAPAENETAIKAAALKNTAKNIFENAVKAFARELGRPLTEIEEMQVKIWLSRHPPEVVLEALRAAVLREKPRLDYVSGILHSWRNAGLATRGGVITHEALEEFLAAHDYGPGVRERALVLARGRPPPALPLSFRAHKATRREMRG